MAKKKSFGFKTPVRRTTKNVTGHKVGGELTGGECELINTQLLELNETQIHEFEVNPESKVGLFNSNIGIVAIGGYFICESDIKLKLSITLNKEFSEITYDIQKDRFYAIGHDFEIDLEEKIESIIVAIEFNVKRKTKIEYSHFSYGFVNKLEYIENEEAYKHYANSKKTICFPEQFYFNEHYIINKSIVGNPIITKSCNRCQRYLPINPFNQRIQLAFSNHCTTKAPCNHKNFSNYKITRSEFDDSEIKNIVKNNFENGYSLDANKNILSYYGHQLECKACKKFFVNAALNHLRTSSQHREDSLRRRAFELLSRNLLGIKWIYHEFRIRTGKEFDKEIWLKFNKKCFNCNKDIKSAKVMHLDHTMPLSHLYPLDETATCLCSSCNNAKSDIFPVDFYTQEKLISLSKYSGLPLELLKSRKANQKVVNLLKNRIIWFVEDFLTHPDYIKVRDGKKAADSILNSVNKAISKSDTKFNILEEYTKLKS